MYDNIIFDEFTEADFQRYQEYLRRKEQVLAKEAVPEKQVRSAKGEDGASE